MQALQTETRQRQRKLVVPPRAPENLNIAPSRFALLLKDTRVEGSRPRDRLLLTRSALQAPVSLLNRAVAFAYRTRAARKRRTLTMQENAPFAELSRFGQRA